MKFQTTKKLPGLLSHIYKPPPLLYIRGNIPDIGPNGKFITVIGPRKPSKYAQEVCRMIVESLVDFPICIVSGLAYGIDALTHEIALDNNIPCIAFPGSGLEDDVLYPRANFNLAKRIIERGGALLCEWQPSTRAAPWTFVARNRLMAGISHATIIIEAGEKSGTLITAKYALEEGRDVFVIPADITRVESKGSNSLISEEASPITNIESLVEKLGFKEKNTTAILESLTSKELRILSSLEKPKTTTDISRETKINIKEIALCLQSLELKDLVFKENIFWYRNKKHPKVSD